MQTSWFEKRKFPRIDTSENCDWKIKVFGVKGKPLEGQIINLSLGGVAFVSHWKKIARTVKRFTPKVEIKLPNGRSVDATSVLVRVKPTLSSDDCLCVLELTDLNRKGTNRLSKYLHL
ncbi:MAG: PilZ domain-containing protein [bacterium]